MTDGRQVDGTLLIIALVLLVGLIPQCIKAVAAEWRRQHPPTTQPPAPTTRVDWRNPPFSVPDHTPTMRFPRHMAGDLRAHPLSPPYRSEART